MPAIMHHVKKTNKKPHSGITDKIIVTVPNRVARMRGAALRIIPLRYRQSQGNILERKPVIICIQRKVMFPKRYAGVFKKGERILEIHIDYRQEQKDQNSNTMPQDIINGIKELKQRFPELKSQGIAGIFGDTQNKAIARIFLQLGGKVIQIPKSAQILARARYRQEIDNSGYSSKYAFSQPERIVFRF